MTVVGSGVGTEPQLVARALSMAAVLGVRVQAVHTGPLHVTLLVPAADLPELTRALHGLTEGYPPWGPPRAEKPVFFRAG